MHAPLKATRRRWKQRGGTVNILSPGQEQRLSATPLRSIFPHNFVRYGVHGDGSCFFHALFMATDKDYQQMKDITQRIQYGQAQRRWLLSVWKDDHAVKKKYREDFLHAMNGNGRNWGTDVNTWFDRMSDPSEWVTTDDIDVMQKTSTSMRIVLIHGDYATSVFPDFLPETPNQPIVFLLHVAGNHYEPILRKNLDGTYTGLFRPLAPSTRRDVFEIMKELLQRALAIDPVLSLIQDIHRVAGTHPPFLAMKKGEALATQWRSLQNQPSVKVEDAYKTMREMQSNEVNEEQLRAILNYFQALKAKGWTKERVDTEILHGTKKATDLSMEELQNITKIIQGPAPSLPDATPPSSPNIPLTLPAAPSTPSTTTLSADSSQEILQQYYDTLGKAVAGIQRMIDRLDDQDQKLNQLRENTRQLHQILENMGNVAAPDSAAYSNAIRYLKATNDLVHKF